MCIYSMSWIVFLHLCKCIQIHRYIITYNTCSLAYIVYYICKNRVEDIVGHVTVTMATGHQGAIREVKFYVVSHLCKIIGSLRHWKFSIAPLNELISYYLLIFLENLLNYLFFIWKSLVSKGWLKDFVAENSFTTAGNCKEFS